jgi:hypothetical protein
MRRPRRMAGRFALLFVVALLNLPSWSGSVGQAAGTIDVNEYINFANSRTWRFRNQYMNLANGQPDGTWVTFSTPNETKVRTYSNIIICSMNGIDDVKAWRWDFGKTQTPAIGIHHMLRAVRMMALRMPQEHTPMCLRGM